MSAAYAGGISDFEDGLSLVDLHFADSTRDGLVETGEVSPCHQLFSLQGKIFSDISQMPSICRLLAGTQFGTHVCNRGCGWVFPNAAFAEPQCFQCPFGISNMAVYHREQSMVLIGGRFFQNYPQLRLFIDTALRAHVNEDALLEECACAVFRQIDEVEKALSGVLNSIPANFVELHEKQNEPAIEITDEEAIVEVQRMELLRQCFSSLLEAPDLSSLGEVLIQEVNAAIRAKKISLFLIDDQGQQLVLANALGLPSDAPIGLRLPLRKGILGQTCATERPILVHDILSDSRFAPSAFRHYSSSSFLSLPLRTGKKTLGVLNVTEREDGAKFTPDEVDWLDLLANSAAAAINSKSLASLLSEARNHALVDSDIQIGSRRFFDLRFNEEFQRTLRHNQPFALALIQVSIIAESREQRVPRLRRIAETVGTALRSFDILTVYDNSTLAVLLPQTDRHQARHVIERVEFRVGELVQSEPEICRIEDLRFGFAAYPTDATTAIELKIAAQCALKSSPRLERGAEPDEDEREVELPEIWPITGEDAS